MHTLKPVIIVLRDYDIGLGLKIAQIFDSEVHAYAKNIKDQSLILFAKLSTHIADLFLSNRPIIAVMASGSLVRILAPFMNNKAHEPPVITVSSDGNSIVPLLGGHHGANSCLLYTSPSPRDKRQSRMPSSA